MKKLFTLLTLLVAMVTSAWADVIVGRWLTGTSDTNYTLSSVTNTTVTLADGTGESGTGKDTYHGSDTKSNYAAKNYRDKKSSAVTAYNSDVYLGYQLVIADGYKLTASQINVDLSVGQNFTYRVVILDNHGNALYTSSDITITNYNSDSATNITKTLSLSNLVLGGTIQVRMYYWYTGNSGSKYLVPITFTMTGALETCSTYTVSTAVDGDGTVTGAGSYVDGMKATLEATPGASTFNHWTKSTDGSWSSTANPLQEAITADVTYTAHFNAATSHTITGAIADGQSTWGSITNSGANVVVEDEEITFVATANTGYGFVKWQKDGVDYSMDASITVTSTADATYTAFFKQLFTINFNVDAENKGTSTTGFGTQYANISDKWTAPLNYYTASEGKTLTAWNDGVNDYTPGTEYTLAGNITVAPIFTANTKSLGDLTAETTVTWTFARSAGAPNLASENNTQYYVKQTTIAGNAVDVPIFVNTVENYGISGKKGKFNNSGNEGYAQVNNGTVFKIPAVKGMLVKYMTNQTSALSNIGFTDNTSNLGGDGSALTTPTVISDDNKTISYTYTGTADYLYLVDIKGGKYPTGLSVTYPEKQTKYMAPTITVGDFSFENKAYPVTITAAEGTLEVSTDGTNYTAQTSPYQVNVTATTHFYAKATGASYDPSDVVDENVVCTFDGGKKYVAWVYESNYANAPSNYAIGSDAIHTALGTIYNVVDVDIKDYKSAITDAQKTALNGNLDDADLVVISEAAAGSSKALIGLKDIVGTVPMLNMKLYAYKSDRWNWGTPDNAAKAVVAITPSSKIYKVLEGVTFKGNDIELFDYPNEQNHIQYVSSWSSEPAGDVVLATTSSKPAMHASTSQKYFALGLSCDDYTKYNANAVAIVKNAAAMLIAGEALNAEVSSVSVTIAASGYSSLASAYGLNFAGATPAGLEAYVASAVTASGVTLNAVTEAPASTGVILKGTPGETYNIPVKADAAAIAGTNYLHAAVAAYNCAADQVYILKGGKFCQVTADSTVPAGKAYLLKSEVDAALAGSAPEYLGFDFGGTTGIKSVDNGQVTVDSSEVYNLAGQRVAQPTKGLYIVNGRKVVIK